MKKCCTVSQVMIMLAHHFPTILYSPLNFITQQTVLYYSVRVDMKKAYFLQIVHTPYIV